MIASLKGEVIDVLPKFMILDVNGVGYKIEGTFLLSLIGKQLFVYVHTHYSENDTRLFGFLKKDDFLMFEMLLTVNGVGPKSASNIIANFGSEKVRSAIRLARPVDLKGGGIGLKTAQKIVIELSGKMETADSLPLNILTKAEEKKFKEVESALYNLGYNKDELSDIFDNLISIKEKESEILLRTALNLLKQKKH